jgi:hypothetical protein
MHSSRAYILDALVFVFPVIEIEIALSIREAITVVAERGGKKHFFLLFFLRLSIVGAHLVDETGVTMLQGLLIGQLWMGSSVECSTSSRRKYGVRTSTLFRIIDDSEHWDVVRG